MSAPGAQAEIEGGLQAEADPLVSSTRQGGGVAQAQEALRRHGARFALCGAAALALLLVPAALLGRVGHRQPGSAKVAASGRFFQPEDVLIEEEAPYPTFWKQPDLGEEKEFRLVTDGTAFSFTSSLYLEETWHERAVFEANPCLDFRIAMDGMVTISMTLLNSKEVVVESSLADVTPLILSEVRVVKTPEKLCLRVGQGAEACKSPKAAGVDPALFQMRPPSEPFKVGEYFVGHSSFAQDVGAVTFSMTVKGLPPYQDIRQSGELAKILLGVRRLFRLTTAIVGPPVDIKNVTCSALPATGGKSSEQNPLILAGGIITSGVGLTKLEDLLGGALERTAERVAGLLSKGESEVQVTDVSCPAAEFRAKEIECPAGQKKASGNLTCQGASCASILCEPATSCGAHACPANTFEVKGAAAKPCAGPEDCDAKCCFAYCDQVKCADPYECVPEKNWNNTCEVGPACEETCCEKKDLPTPCCQEYSVDCISCHLCMPAEELCALRDAGAATTNATEAKEMVESLQNNVTMDEIVTVADVDAASVDALNTSRRRLNDIDTQELQNEQQVSTEDKEEADKEEAKQDKQEEAIIANLERAEMLESISEEQGIYAPRNESRSSMPGGRAGYYEMAKDAANVAVGCVPDNNTRCPLRLRASFRRPGVFFSPAGPLQVQDYNISAVAPLKDGSRGIVAFTDGNLYTFVLCTGALDHWLGVHITGITALAVLDDGVHIVIGSEGGDLKVINVNDPRFTMSQKKPVLGVDGSDILSLASVPAWSMVLVGSSNNFTTFWNWRTGNALRMPRNVASNESQADTRSRTATLVADVWYPGPRSGPNPATMKYLDPIFQKHLPSLQSSFQDVRNTFALYPKNPPTPTDNTFGTVNSVAYVPVRARFVTGHADGRVRYWSAQTGKLLIQFVGHKGPVWTVAAHPTAEIVYSGGEDGTVRGWDPRSGLEIMKFETIGGPVKSLSVIPGGFHMYAGSIDGILRVFDISKVPGLYQCQYPILHGSIMSVAASIGQVNQVIVGTQKGWVGVYE